jgi:tetratricopeptide (TPR) repeat protein
LNKNQPQAAIQSCQQAITAHQQIKDRSGEAKSTVNLGIAHVRANQYEQAIPILQSASELAKTAGERRVKALALEFLGLAYSSLGKWQEAQEFLQQALAIATEIKDTQLEEGIRQVLSLVENPQQFSQKTEAARLLQQGLQQAQNSQFQEAVQSWEAALKIYREIGVRQGEAESLGNLGNAYNNLGQYQKAIEYHQQALAIFKEIGAAEGTRSARDGEAASLGNLGNAYNYLGEYQKAIEYHQQSLAIFKEIGDRQGEAASLGNLGNAYRTHLGSLVGKDYSKYGESDRAAPPSLGAKRSVPRRSP